MTRPFTLTRPFTEADAVSLARNAVGKVDRLGPRGVTLVTALEIEAMAVVLACLGITPQIPEKGTPT